LARASAPFSVCGTSGNGKLFCDKRDNGISNNIMENILFMFFITPVVCTAILPIISEKNNNIPRRGYY
jgi:hypothetical protein